MQQGVQTDATRNVQQCWELLAMLRPFERGFIFKTHRIYLGVRL